MINEYIIYLKEKMVEDIKNIFKMKIENICFIIFMFYKKKFFFYSCVRLKYNYIYEILFNL